MTKRKNKSQGNIIPLIIILVSIIVVFIISRFLTYLILIKNTLPSILFLNLNGFRLHHFVYGNVIITITSFIAIGLGIRRHRNLFALFYGIGLGLVLDEFLLWMGSVEQLTSNVLFIPYSMTAVALASIFISSIIMYRLYYKHARAS